MGDLLNFWKSSGNQFLAARPDRHLSLPFDYLAPNTVPLPLCQPFLVISKGLGILIERVGEIKRIGLADIGIAGIS